MGEVACRAADAVDYVGAGTVEFLMDRDHNFYFLEMNTRLQVEHPVTELCCGIDLVEAQIRIAQGEPIGLTQDEIKRTGHAIEARLYAEDPSQNFLPSPGFIRELNFPHWPGVRIDCGVSQGFEVPRYYDPMIAKVIAYGEDREQARRRLHRALEETAVKGITTNNRFLIELLDSEEFISGNYHTGSIAELMARDEPESSEREKDIATIAAVIQTFAQDRQSARLVATGSETTGTGTGPGWRGTSWRRGMF